MAVASKYNSDSTGANLTQPSQNLLMIAKFWEKAQPHLTRIRPYLSKIVPVLSQVATKASSVSRTVIAPHYNDEIGKTMWNVILVFFGGQFALTIMAIQAFNMTGSVMIKNSLSQLRESYKEAMLKLSLDPQARALMDTNKDGSVSLEEVGQAVVSSLTGETAESRGRAKELVSVCLKCIDPNKILEAFTGFLVGAMAIVAILRSQIAKCVSIGAKIGEHIAVFLKSKTQKALYEKYPEHKNWVDAGLRSGAALIGVIVSFMLVKIVNSFNCALQGAEGLSSQALQFAHKKGKLLSIKSSDTSVQAVTIALVFVGVSAQLRTGFSIPWYLKLILLPAVLSENLLSILSVI